MLVSFWVVLCLCSFFVSIQSIIMALQFFLVFLLKSALQFFLVFLLKSPVFLTVSPAYLEDLLSFLVSCHNFSLFWCSPGFPEALLSFMVSPLPATRFPQCFTSYLGSFPYLFAMLDASIVAPNFQCYDWFETKLFSKEV